MNEFEIKLKYRVNNYANNPFCEILILNSSFLLMLFVFFSNIWMYIEFDHSISSENWISDGIDRDKFHKNLKYKIFSMMGINLNWICTSFSRTIESTKAKIDSIRKRKIYKIERSYRIAQSEVVECVERVLLSQYDDFRDFSNSNKQKNVLGTTENKNI